VIGAVAVLLIGFLVLSGGDDEGTAGSSSVDGSVSTTIAGTSTSVETTLANVPGEIFLEPADGVGPIPFTPSVDVTPPGLIPPAGGEPVAPSAPFPGDDLPPPSAAGAIQALPGNSPGLYGGTRDNASCDKEQLVTFLEANTDKAAAWAAVQQIQPSEIRAYVAGLTPVLLRTDTRVTNYGFKDGKAPARQVVLEAGTAVLVDEFGVPRARCFCGNPLREPQPEPTPTYTGDQWPGFDPATVTVVAPSPEPIDTFTLVDVVTAEPFNRPAGTDEGADAPAPPDVLSTTTTTTTTPTSSTTTTTTTPLPPVDVTSQGMWGVSSEYPGGEFPAALAHDGDETTSWFSAGDDDASCVPVTPDVLCSDLSWVRQDPGDVLIRGIEIINNSKHPDFPTGFGFGSVVIIITNAAGTVVDQQTIPLPGEDPNVIVAPNVMGHSVRFVFEGHDSPDCGGISEFRVLS
jgi:hypothetical protein